MNIKFGDESIHYKSIYKHWDWDDLKREFKRNRHSIHKFERRKTKQECRKVCR